MPEYTDARDGQWPGPGLPTILNFTTTGNFFAANERESTQMESDDRILIDSDICHGKPVIDGTRVPVAIVVGSLAGGMSFAEVQQEYDLSIEDIRAVLAFPTEMGSGLDP